MIELPLLRSFGSIEDRQDRAIDSRGHSDKERFHYLEVEYSILDAKAGF
jgi:hypothetical protein